jgi:hypothetical protein
MITSLAVTRPEVIATTTAAKRPPETTVEYDAPVLAIYKGRVAELYDVAEFPCGFDGRAFRLAKDSDGEVYNVFVCRHGQSSTCDCAGFTYTSDSPTGGKCKHMDAVLHLVRSGQLDDPRGAGPLASWPTPEQLAAAPF